MYLRSTNSDNKKHVSFVTGNSKIARKNPITIPRLELCAALDVAMAVHDVTEKLSIPLHSVFLFSDSMIVFGYLKNETKRFSRFVTRRVSLILESFPSSQWCHVPTANNPADIASRPQCVQSLQASFWLTGPAFFYDDNPINHQFSEPANLPETID